MRPHRGDVQLLASCYRCRSMGATPLWILTPQRKKEKTFEAVVDSSLVWPLPSPC